jgi:hypothetical protein
LDGRFRLQTRKISRSSSLGLRGLRVDRGYRGLGIRGRFEAGLSRGNSYKGYLRTFAFDRGTEQVGCGSFDSSTTHTLFLFLLGEVGFGADEGVVPAVDELAGLDVAVSAWLGPSPWSFASHFMTCAVAVFVGASADPAKFLLVRGLVEKETTLRVSVDGTLGNRVKITSLESRGGSHRLVVVVLVVEFVSKLQVALNVIVLIVRVKAFGFVRMESNHSGNLGKTFVSEINKKINRIHSPP